MFLRSLKAAVIAVLVSLSLSVIAGANDPLFINLTTDDVHRANMAITFGKHHSGNGHPLSIFLNDKGVILGVKAGSEKYAAQQKELADIIAKGGLVIICPSCLKNAGYTETDLLAGVKLGGPKLTGDALFKDGTKTMSW
jgi:sulfur relay (sulfurtransferase) complex TusBCD TusD component (DsrE family)